MATALNRRQQTLEEFLTWEREQPERYERVSGVIRVMTGGTLDHNRITLNVADALRQQLRGGDCEIFANDVRVITPAGDVMYPDAVVACGELPARRPCWMHRWRSSRFCRRARLSATMAASGGRTRPSRLCVHYVLVDQDEGSVEVTSPNEDGTWHSVILRDISDRLQLPALKVVIGLEEVFARVAFRRATAGAGATDAS